MNEAGTENETKIAEIQNETEIETVIEIAITVGVVIDDREATAKVAAKLRVEVEAHLDIIDYKYEAVISNSTMVQKLCVRQRICNDSTE